MHSCCVGGCHYRTQAAGNPPGIRLHRRGTRPLDSSTRSNEIHIISLATVAIDPTNELTRVLVGALHCRPAMCPGFKPSRDRVKA